MFNIEIIPNWHPLFVHFTIALFSTATLLFLMGIVFKNKSWSLTVLKTAHVNLWLGAGFTLITLLAGWDAYNSVAHDGPSHAAMTDHRNWAIPTAGLWIVLAIWSFITYRKSVNVKIPFVIVLLIATGMLATTGFKGSEAVYRYGLGVMSLPAVAGDGGHGSHAHGEVMEMDHGSMMKDMHDAPEASEGHRDDHATPHAH